LKLYRTWRGKLEKRGAQLIAISTAGEPGGEFEETRSRIKKEAREVSTSAGGCHTRAAGDDIVIHDFAVPSIKQAEDMEVVARANPRPEMTAERLRKKRESPTMTPEHWLRFVCNIATLTGGSAIQPEEWDRLEEPGLVVPDGRGAAGGSISGGRSTRPRWACSRGSPRSVGSSRASGCSSRRWMSRRSSRASCTRRSTTREHLGARSERRRGADGPAPREGAASASDGRRLRAEHGLPALTGHEEPLEFIAHSQDNAPMSQAATRLDEAIRNGWLVHDGTGSLRAHVLNAVARSLGDAKWKYDRPADAKGERRKNYPIDALTGVLMGNNIAVE
jgi:hypothetical protein